MEDARTISGGNYSRAWLSRRYAFVVSFNRPFTSHRVLPKKEGEKVSEGDVIATCYSSDEGKLAAGIKEIGDSIVYSDVPVDIKNIVIDTVN